MTNIDEMSYKEFMQQWFENSCNFYAEHYSFLLGLTFINTKVDEVWYREQYNMNKIFDV